MIARTHRRRDRGAEFHPIDNRHFPAAQHAGRCAGGEAAGIEQVFVMQRDIDVVARKDAGADRHLAIVTPHQPAGDAIILDALVIGGQLRRVGHDPCQRGRAGGRGRHAAGLRRFNHRAAGRKARAQHPRAENTAQARGDRWRHDAISRWHGPGPKRGIRAVLLPSSAIPLRRRRVWPCLHRQFQGCPDWWRSVALWHV